MMGLSSKFKKNNNIYYQFLIDKDGKCSIRTIPPVFEFDSYDELETVLKTQI